MKDFLPWTGEIYSVLRINSEGLEHKIIGRKTFLKQGLLILDDRGEDGDIVITYNAMILERLLEKGKIPQEVGEPLLQEFKRYEIEQLESQKFAETYSQHAKQNRAETCHQPCIGYAYDREKIAASVRHILSFKNIIEEEKAIVEMKPLFRKHLRQSWDFGITKALMDRLVYIPELLNQAKLKRVCEDLDHYSIVSDFSATSKGEPIGLEYHFIASGQNAAQQIFEIYKEEMSKEALKVFLGFWREANLRGRFDFTSAITTVMSHTSNQDRQSYFSVKEKKKFWALVKLLENTKLTLRIPYKEKKGKKEKIVVIGHRLIEIFARDIEKSEEQEGYPNKIKVRVLNPEEFQEKAQLATAIANGTARLPPQDIMLALCAQTRASQRRAQLGSNYDEDYLIKKANLENTNLQNPSVARRRLAKKLTNLQNERVIAGWEKSNGQYHLKYNREENQIQEED